MITYRSKANPKGSGRTAEVPGRPRSRLHTGSGAGPRPMQNNFVVSAGRKGNFAWAAQRLSRAAALAARHWQNPKAYREGLSGNRDPEDLRDEEVQIQVLGAMGGHSLEHSLRQTAVMNSEADASGLGILKSSTSSDVGIFKLCGRAKATLRRRRTFDKL
eukprot:s680_g9.t2